MTAPSPTLRRSQRPHSQVSAPYLNKIRCQCETENEKSELIECEVCNKWQHTYCMGIIAQTDRKDYQCEVCKPRLLMVTRSNARRHQTRSTVPAPVPTATAIKRTQAIYDLDFEKFAHFLARECETHDLPIGVYKIFEEAKEHCEFEGAISSFIVRCRRKMIVETHVMEQFGMDTRAKMFFVSRAPVDDKFLEELRESAAVTVDTAQRIVSYESPTLKFEGTAYGPRNRASLTLSGSRTTPASGGRRGRGRPRRIARPSMPRLSVAGTSTPNTGRRPSEEDIQLVFNGGFVPAPLKIEPEPPAYQRQVTTFAPAPPPLPQQMYMAPRPFYPAAMEDRSVINGVSNFVRSMSGFFETQTKFVKDLVEKSVPPPPPPIPESHMSIYSFLQYLKMIIGSIDNPTHLSTLNQLIIDKIAEIGEDRQMGQKRLKTAIEAMISLTSTFSSQRPQSNFQQNYYTQAKNFHRLLYIYAFGHNSNGLINGVCDRLKAMTQREGEEHIPIERIRMAMEAAVGIVSSGF